MKLKLINLIGMFIIALLSIGIASGAPAYPKVNTMSDDFNDGDYTSNPAWNVILAPWYVINNSLFTDTNNAQIQRQNTSQTFIDDYGFELSADLSTKTQGVSLIGQTIGVGNTSGNTLYLLECVIDDLGSDNNFCCNLQWRQYPGGGFGGYIGAINSTCISDTTGFNGEDSLVNLRLRRNDTGYFDLYSNDTFVRDFGQDTKYKNDWDVIVIKSQTIGVSNSTWDNIELFANTTAIVAGDVTAPSLIFTPVVDAIKELGDNQAITISCVDETALDECYYNVTEPDTTLTQYTTNETIALDQIGNWSLLFYADDTSDNINTSTVTLEVLDTTTPTLTNNPADDFAKAKDETQEITISCTDIELDDCYYNVTEPDTTLTQYTTNETITFDQVGSWTFLFYSDDTTGNTETDTVTATVSLTDAQVEVPDNAVAVFAITIIVLFVLMVSILPKKWLKGDSEKLILFVMVLLLLLLGLMYILNLWNRIIG